MGIFGHAERHRAANRAAHAANRDDAHNPALRVGGPVVGKRHEAQRGRFGCEQQLAEHDGDATDHIGIDDVAHRFGARRVVGAEQREHGRGAQAERDHGHHFEQHHEQRARQALEQAPVVRAAQHVIGLFRTLGGALERGGGVVPGLDGDDGCACRLVGARIGVGAGVRVAVSLAFVVRFVVRLVVRFVVGQVVGGFHAGGFTQGFLLCVCPGLRRERDARTCGFGRLRLRLR